MPRQDKILEATCLDGCSCRLFPISANQSMTQGKLMEEASSSWLTRGLGEERIELKTQFQTQPPCAHLMCTSLIAYWRGIWLWSCFIVWMQIKEQESGERQMKILKCTCYFKTLDWGKWKSRGLIPTSLFDSQRIEQHIPVIKLESRF